ncbi:MAG: OmpA family protein [Rhodospirillales bacterium]|nr:OmpA family protein [Rhodospirillales bacterium]
MKRLLIAVSLLAMAAPAAQAQQGGTMPGMHDGASSGDMEMMSDKYLVFFGLNQSKLTPEAQEVVAKAAEQYKATGAVSINVTGHTDTTGTKAYNQRLSERRAAAVADELVRQGVPATNITTVGEGQTNLLVPTGDGVNEPQNRRAEIVIERPVPVAAEPAPVEPEPVVASPVPFVPRGAVAFGPWYGFSIKESDPSGDSGKTSASLVGGNLIFDFFATKNLPLTLNLVAYNTVGTSGDDGWGYRGTLGPTFEMNALGVFRPYFGIYGGYITGKGAQDGPLVGPELGFKVGMGDQAYIYTKIGYDYLFRNSWDEGIPNAGIGFGYRF